MNKKRIITVMTLILTITLSGLQPSLATSNQHSPFYTTPTKEVEIEVEIDEELRKSSQQLESINISENKISLETSFELSNSSELTQEIDIDVSSGVHEVSIQSDNEDIDNSEYLLEIHQLNEELIWFTLYDPITGESYESRSDYATYDAIPLALVLVPSLGAALKALFVASAVIVVVGVTYIAAEKAIPKIEEAIRRKKNPPAHYKATIHNDGLWIGDRMEFNEAILWARAGKNVWSSSQSGASSIAYNVRLQKAIGPERDKYGNGKYCHYHPATRSPGSHMFYGTAARGGMPC